MGPVYDVEPGADYLIPFARKRLAQTATRAAEAGCPFLKSRVSDDGSATADVEAGPVNRIRVRPGGTPWYFFAQEIAPVADGVQRIYWDTGTLAGTRLTRVPAGSVSTFAGSAITAIRTLGRSIGVFYRPLGGTKFLSAIGRVAPISDPLGVLATDTARGLNSLSVGISRIALCYASAPGGVFFTDGGIVENVAVTPTAVGTVVVGDAPYYWTTHVSGAGTVFNLYRGSDAYPTDPDTGAQIPVTPIPLESFAVVPPTGGQAWNSRGVRVISNEYDIMTVLTRFAHTTVAPGAIEIRIGHSLVWSSPGTLTDSSLVAGSPNPDDVGVLVALGNADEFVVVLGNLVATRCAVAPASTTTAGGFFLRVLRFTRQEDLTYALSEHTYYTTGVKQASVDSAFCPAGLRTFVSHWREIPSVVDKWTAGWIRDDGVLNVARDYGAGSADAPLVGLVSVVGGVYAITRRGLVSFTFFESESLGFLDCTPDSDPSPTIFPLSVVVAFAGNDTTAYICVLYDAQSITAAPCLLGSDGSKYTVPRVAGAIPTNLAVDETNRTVHSVTKSNVVVPDASAISVVRHDHQPQTLFTYEDSMEYPGGLVFPALSEQYRNRLLRRWKSEDEAAEE